ncbi:MAG TPA: hypothetical protein PK622_02585, partial [Saprospiraceae bacterium]|nr:hypothetical protein [Saprospiraceae bacterium]
CLSITIIINIWYDFWWISFMNRDGILLLTLKAGQGIYTLITLAIFFKFRFNIFISTFLVRSYALHHKGSITSV